ncbi:MAG TPA: hypothetical protein ENI23_01180 [bacterium]|nr:hypothetical protein [bacterium]
MVESVSSRSKSLVDVFTAQFQYSGSDRLDITVKGQDPLGRYFAPSWYLVNEFKYRGLSKSKYKETYLLLMIKSREKHSQEWKELLARDKVTLVCFCKAGTFCHRLLLANFLEELGAVYKGERRLRDVR